MRTAMTGPCRLFVSSVTLCASTPDWCGSVGEHDPTHTAAKGMASSYTESIPATMGGSPQRKARVLTLGYEHAWNTYVESGANMHLT